MDNSARVMKGFLSESRFSLEAFSSPARDYAPVYTWMWNARITDEETDRQLEEMARMNIKRLYVLPMPKSFRPASFPTPLDPEYLSDGYFKAYRHAVKKARELNMGLWLYDEGGWPSGGACGQVMLSDPTLVAETIRVQERPILKGETYLPERDVEATFFEGKRVFKGYCAAKDGVLTEYIHVKTSFPGINSADYPDVTKAGTMPTFLAMTLDKHAQALEEDLAAMDAVFTDEPTAPRPFPYTEEVKALFKNAFHKDIEDCLPELMGKAICTEDSAKIKVEFFRLLSDLFISRALKPEKAWANAHSLAFIGHLDKDDEPNGSMTGGSFGLLTALRSFDVPGVDAIRRQIFPPKGKSGNYGKNAFFPLLASSAAAQNGGRHALSESFAVYGAGLSYDEMRYIVNFQAMCGVNVFNYMLIPYGRKGYALAGELPHFTEKTTPDLALFNEYTARLCYLFSLGERKVGAALYLPDADGFLKNDTNYESLGEDLMAKRIPFDIVDDGFLRLATVKEGSIGLGRAAYEAILLPDCYLPEQSKAALAAFIKEGGKVICSPAMQEKVPGAKSEDLSTLAPSFPAMPEGILLSRASTDEGDLVFLMNETGKNKTFPLRFDKNVYYLTPTDGAVRRAEKGTEHNVTLCSGEIVALLFTEREIASAPFFEGEEYVGVDSTLFRPLKRTTLGEEYTEETLSEPFAPLPFGDWKTRLGEGFSGTGEYKMTFRLPENVKEATLDLGKAERVAEVYLNGVPLGKKIMPPYRYPLPNYLLQRENQLSIKVTNGIANEFEGTTAFDKYSEKQLGNYLDEERLFHADSKESGLFGKVKIYIS